MIRNGSVGISQLPFRAYQLVWNEYFRNQNVQNEVEFPHGSGSCNDSDIPTFSFRKNAGRKITLLLVCLGLSVVKQ